LLRQDWADGCREPMPCATRLWRKSQCAVRSASVSLAEIHVQLLRMVKGTGAVVLITVPNASVWGYLASLFRRMLALTHGVALTHGMQRCHSCQDAGIACWLDLGTMCSVTEWLRCLHMTTQTNRLASSGTQTLHMHHWKMGTRTNASEVMAVAPPGCLVDT
jgi:hypothetical protein